MKHLVVGAGATLAEALALGNRWENCPPLISNFARKTWNDYTPSPYLDFYIKELGCWREVSDARELFYELEGAGLTISKSLWSLRGITDTSSWTLGRKYRLVIFLGSAFRREVLAFHRLSKTTGSGTTYCTTVSDGHLRTR